MLPKKHQLKSNKDFQAVHSRGKFFGSKFMAIKVLKNNLKDTRFGFVVGIKISKKAVVRNKVKRRLRAAVQEYLQELKPGFDVVVLVRPEIVERNFEDVKKTLIETLRKAGLLQISNS